MAGEGRFGAVFRVFGSPGAGEKQRGDGRGFMERRGGLVINPPRVNLNRGSV